MDRNQEIEYGFWFYSDQLTGILVMLSQLVSYKMDQDEIEVIKQDLIGTNDEMNRWVNYLFNEKMNLSLAYDGEEETQIIHIRIRTTENLKPKLEALDLFQSLFKKLELNERMP